MVDTRTPLDDAASVDDELRVSTLELFFDLVFVFTLTQLTALLEHDVSLESGLRVVLIFIVLFWMYGGFAWLTNQVPPTEPASRLLLIAGMAAFLVCALAVPGAFGEDGVAFGVGYAAVVAIHGGLFTHAYGRQALRFVPFNLLGAACVIAAGLVDGPAVYALWVAPIALQYFASWITRRIDEPSSSGLSLRVGHFVERHGLLLIVAFGESVVAIGIGIGETELDLGTYGAAILGLILVAALWWTYFADDAERAEDALRHRPVGEQVGRALNAYFYAFVPMLLGIVTLAAGIALTIGHVTEPADPGAAALIGGGVVLYLGGDVAFRTVLGLAPVGIRAAAVPLAAATIALGVAVSAIVQLAALVAVLVLVLLLESRAQPRSIRPRSSSARA